MTETVSPGRRSSRGRKARPSTSHLPWKTPGADLRRQRGVTLELSLMLALLIVLGLFHAPIRFEEAFVVTVKEQEVVQMEEITQTKQMEKPPPPPRPPVPVEVPDDALLEADADLNLDASLDINEPLADLPPPPPRAEEAEEKAIEEPEFFVVVEEMPELIGGLEGLAAKVRYPDIARRAGIEGRVIVQFIIDEEGRIRDAVVIRGQGAALDEEALRVVRTARFTPGRQRGKPVKVRMSIPIIFRLRDARSSS